MYFSANGSYLPPIAGRTNAVVGFNENASLPFEPGKTYRLRIINMSAFSAFFFWIDGHNMTLIEADGVSLCFFISLKPA
jgi:iron transport multicopper oxidase